MSIPPLSPAIPAIIAAGIAARGAGPRFPNRRPPTQERRMITSYTEDVAKTKWCPEARVFSSHTAVNRTDVPWPKCVASDCMFWQWDHDAQPECSHPDMEPMERRGFCGLAVR
jgi:hypothetical protein